jgi:hypothetical protein
VGVVRDVVVLAFEFEWENFLLGREDLSILGTMQNFDLDTISRVWDIVSGVCWEISMGPKGIGPIVEFLDYTYDSNY